MSPHARFFKVDTKTYNKPRMLQTDVMNTRSQRVEGAFPVGRDELRYSWTRLAEPRGTMLYLHGGGNGRRSRAAYLADALAEVNIATFAFDFSGQGESSGSLLGASLELRVQEALAAIEFMGASRPTILMGNSMGGYVAAEIATQTKISTLVLSVPGLYAAAAYNVPFGPEFTRILRTPQSYRTSRVLPLLSRFRGNAVLISAGRDDVIPTEVIDLYRQALEGANLEMLHFEEAPHQIHEWAQANPSSAMRIAERIASQAVRG